MRFTPHLLMAIRFLLGPLVYWLAHNNINAAFLALALTIAFLSDIFDGVIARRLKIATKSLRVTDSRVDAWYFAWILVTLWKNSRPLLHPYLSWIVLILCLQIFSYALDIVMYRQIASFHAYSTKVWGLTLFLATFAILVFHIASPWIQLTVLASLISFVDTAIIKWFLPCWQHDVPSCFHAYRMYHTSKKQDL